MSDSLRCLVIPTDARFHPSIPLDVLEAPADEGMAEFVADLVGGHFQVVAGPARSSMYLHEEGKFVPLQENQVATALAHEAGLSMADWIAGQVVVVGRPDEIGYDTSVPDELLVLLEQRGCEIRGRS